MGEMKPNFLKVLTLSLLLNLGTAFGSVAAYNSSGLKLGVANGLQCSTGTSCSMTAGGKLLMTSVPSSLSSLTLSGDLTANGNILGDGGDTIFGFLNKQVAATATTITASQCGSTFYNSGAVAIVLPLASTVLGCRLTFITANAANFDVNPNDLDQILVLTNAAGDMIRNATLGNSVVIQAGAALQWYEISAVGTWSDAN